MDPLDKILAIVMYRIIQANSATSSTDRSNEGKMNDGSNK